jgi:hypothetical protein
MKSKWSRRRVLRGILEGGAVTVGLPLLDCFLNDNGTALADGKPMPQRFGTWFWGLGVSARVFVPSTTGANYELPEEIQALKPVQQHINVLTNFQAFRDGNENLCHFTGWIINRTGQAPKNRTDLPGETLDVTVANQIGRTTRFKMLTATATGEPRTTVSYENANSPTTPEYTPLNFYQTIFGPNFQDPNAPSFTPNPTAMVRRSVLSGVMDEAKDLSQQVGAADRARLDQYFTTVRHLEQQFDQQLRRPEPIAACIAPKPIGQDVPPGRDTDLVARRHQLMTELMVMALACDQTRVFNMHYSNPFADTIQTGYERPHHTATHEEGIDEQLGYQPHVSWFTRRAMESWAQFVGTFTQVKEGDGTLLDNCFITADSDSGFARVHSLDGMAMFTAGRAGGKVRSGLHVDGNGTPTARLGYTALRLMGVNAASFGGGSNTTSKAIAEILV